MNSETGGRTERCVEIKQVVNEFEWILKFAEPDVKSDDLLSSALDFSEQFSKK